MASNRPEQFARIVDMLSRGWVTSDDAANDNGALRLATFIDELANDMDLNILRERRYFEGGRPLKAYILPPQMPKAFLKAAETLPEFQRSVSRVLTALEFNHPLRGLALPPLPGRALSELSPGERKARGDDGKHLNRTVFEMLQEPGYWVTSRFIYEHYDSQRLASIVKELRYKGHNVITEMRNNPTGKGRHGAYHLFTDKDEESAYVKAAGEKALARKKAEEDAVKRSAAAKEAARAAKATLRAGRSHRRQQQSLPGTTQLGRWMQSPSTLSLSAGPAFTRPVSAPMAPSAPSASVTSRLDALSKAASAPARDFSAPHIPAAELNAAFPRAVSNEVVAYEGVQYRRKFRPAKSPGSGSKWEPFWLAEASTPAAAGTENRASA
jgi:hypothetical protein